MADRRDKPTSAHRRRTGRPIPRFNNKLFNCNNLNIRYWSWNYCGCWHQTCPPMDPPYDYWEDQPGSIHKSGQDHVIFPQTHGKWEQTQT
ncbi:hypothetical protein YC2023_108256 [Brassica napus]